MTTDKARVISAKVVLPVAVTADDTDFDTFTLGHVLADGSDNDTIASISTKITAGTGDIVALTPVNIPLDPTADQTLAPGDSLTFTCTIGGTGVEIASAAASAMLILLIEEAVGI